MLRALRCSRFVRTPWQSEMERKKHPLVVSKYDYMWLVDVYGPRVGLKEQLWWSDPQQQMTCSKVCIVRMSPTFVQTWRGLTGWLGEKPLLSNSRSCGKDLVAFTASPNHWGWITYNGTWRTISIVGVSWIHLPRHKPSIYCRPAGGSDHHPTWISEAGQSLRHSILSGMAHGNPTHIVQPALMCMHGCIYFDQKIGIHIFFSFAFSSRLAPQIVPRRFCIVGIDYNQARAEWYTISLFSLSCIFDAAMHMNQTYPCTHSIWQNAILFYCKYWYIYIYIYITMVYFFICERKGHKRAWVPEMQVTTRLISRVSAYLRLFHWHLLKVPSGMSNQMPLVKIRQNMIEKILFVVFFHLTYFSLERFVLT